MTRQSTKQRGVSLVEVILVLAISSILVTTVLAGRNSVRSQAQFIDGMERIKEQILLTKSDANTGKSATASGTSTGYLLLGESIKFSKVSNTNMYIYNVMCKANSDMVCGDSVTTSTMSASRKTIATPWKISYLGYTTGTSTTVTPKDVSLIFIRNDLNGGFTGAWKEGEIASGSQNKLGDVINPNNQIPVTLHFASTDGRKATIVVNPATGTVTKEVQ